MKEFTNFSGLRAFIRINLRKGLKLLLVDSGLYKGNEALYKSSFYAYSLQNNKLFLRSDAKSDSSIICSYALSIRFHCVSLKKALSGLGIGF